MLTQTRNTIGRLLAAGLKRDEFSVQAKRTIKTVQGVRHAQYGLPQITLFGTLDKRLELAPKLAEEFSVTIMYLGDKPSVVLVEEPGTEYENGVAFRYVKGLHHEYVKA